MIHVGLEYAALMWSPSLNKDIRKLERIQRAATKISNSYGYSFEEWLKRLSLTTLEEKRRGDLVAL